MDDSSALYGGLASIYQGSGAESGLRALPGALIVRGITPVRPPSRSRAARSRPPTRAAAVYSPRHRKDSGEDEIVYEGHCGGQLVGRRPGSCLRNDDAFEYSSGQDITDDIYRITSRPRLQGGLSDVYSGYWRTPHGPEIKVALKVVRLPGASRERVLRKLGREILVWKSLRHPNILELCGIHLGMEDYPAMLVEVLEGLQYLHTRDPPIVHGDLKGANILVSTTGEALLCDFGLASVTGEHSASHNSTIKGTCRWMAPELFTDDDPSHTMFSDIWAFGCVALELISGQRPYCNISNDRQVIIALFQGQLPHRPADTVPDPLWKVMLDCWIVEPGHANGDQSVFAMVIAFMGGRSPRQDRALRIAMGGSQY
ncbi:kinase-like protein [Exidia glandulosa HHB12029]|uniref:Kinase-like protein n=1 Tax=Exidia glandulosa HHB12029 TaxID=1314781 RepID=A0A165B5F1_EXIGL|nr:kinase-like protein [Exidia glandulosa HHB12029]